MSPRARTAALAVVLSLGGCRLFVDVDGLTGGPEDGGAPADAASERTPDATSPVDASQDVVNDVTLDADAGADADAEAGPPITFVGSSIVSPVQNVTMVQLPKPNGVVTDDVVLVGLFTDLAATSVTTPANFTKLQDLTIGTGSDTHGWWYVHVVGASEPSSTTFTLNTSSPFVSAVAVAYRNVRVGTPVDTSGFQTSSGTAYIAPSITTTVPNTMLVGIYMADDTVSAVWTAPSGMTQRNATGICAAFDKLQPATGATGPIVALSDANAGGENGVIALAPKF